MSSNHIHKDADTAIHELLIAVQDRIRRASAPTLRDLTGATELLKNLCCSEAHCFNQPNTYTGEETHEKSD